MIPFPVFGSKSAMDFAPCDRGALAPVFAWFPDNQFGWQKTKPGFPIFPKAARPFESRSVSSNHQAGDG